MLGLLGFVGSEVAGASVPDLVGRVVRVGSEVPSEIDTTTDAVSTLDLVVCDGSVPDPVPVVDEVEEVPSLVGVAVEEP